MQARSARSRSTMPRRSSWPSRTRSRSPPASIGFSTTPGSRHGSPGRPAIGCTPNSGSAPCSTGWKSFFDAPPMPIATARAKSRFSGRARVVGRALVSRAWTGARRSRPIDPERILIAHHLLLGDTLMLTALIAKLRERHPRADILMALPEAYAALYAAAPYGVRAIGWSPRDPSASPLWREKGFDLAIVPGDNRMSWLALALDARWIVAFAGDRPATKSWPVDELWRYPDRAAAWGDMVAGLIEEPPPSPFRPERWPAPRPEPAITVPSGPYAVLHVGASSALKRWSPARWTELAARFAACGIEPVWSAGPGENAIVRACDPDARYRSVAEALSLPQLWQ